MLCLTNKHLEAYNTTSWSAGRPANIGGGTWQEQATTGRKNMYWKETAGVDGHGRFLLCSELHSGDIMHCSRDELDNVLCGVVFIEACEHC